MLAIEHGQCLFKIKWCYGLVADYQYIAAGNMLQQQFFFTQQVIANIYRVAALAEIYIQGNHVCVQDY